MLEITPLFSGSSGNSTHIKTDSCEFLIDAGVSLKMLEEALQRTGSTAGNISFVLVTHEHNDHIRGLEMLCKKYKMPVYMNSCSANAIAISGKNPFLCGCIKCFEPRETVGCGGLEIRAFRTPHDACGSVGYRIDEAGGDSFSYVTDIGYVTRDIANNIFGSKTVVFESNHDVEMLKNGIYPQYLKSRILSDRGHLSNDACSKFVPFLAEKGAERIILAHLSEDNNTPEKAYSTSYSALCDAGHKHVKLEVAPRSILNCNET